MGQPTLRRRIRLGAFAALDQRIALRYSMAAWIPPRQRATSRTIARSRAAPTRCSPTTRSPSCTRSRGLPRAVNNLAVQFLVAAFADGKAIVDESSARAAVTEVTTD